VAVEIVDRLEVVDAKKRWWPVLPAAIRHYTSQYIEEGTRVVDPVQAVGRRQTADGIHRPLLPPEQPDGTQEKARRYAIPQIPMQRLRERTPGWISVV
jgi:hypothetical protein